MSASVLFRIPVGTWISYAVDWVTTTLSGFFDLVAMICTGFYDAVDWLFVTPPVWLLVLLIAALGIWARGWLFGAGSLVGLLAIYGMDQWDNAMNTIALTVVATAIAVAISVPVGIWAARSPSASTVIRPILDFFQTMPAFVYLIPAIILFGVGAVPGIIATILFALAPGVRLTELGIRSVDAEVVEAGSAFGASPWRILWQIQLPLARPSIMAGINQVIMLSLSMVVIAGMVGAPGLGSPIVASFQTIDVGLGFEAGLAVVILAILLDRLTAVFGTGRTSRPRLSRVNTSSAPSPAEDAPSPGAMPTRTSAGI